MFEQVEKRLVYYSRNALNEISQVQQWSVNHDGRVGTEDALDAAIQCVSVASDSLQQIRTACRDGKVSQAEAAHVAQLLADVINQCSITQQVVMSIAQPERRKAK